MNPKSRLNELCQKQNITLQYKTQRIDGPDHKPVFESIIKFQSKFFSAKANSKAKAEEELAIQILELFNKSNNSNKNEIFNENKIILVDLENVPNIGNLTERFKVIGFASKYGSIYTMNTKYTSMGVDMNFINSSANNSADVFMIYYIMKHFEELKNYELVILSRDKFSVAFKEIIQECENFNIQLATTINDI